MEAKTTKRCREIVRGLAWGFLSGVLLIRHFPRRYAAASL